MKSIIITVAADAGVTIETQGYKGESCANATKIFEEALGIVGDSKKKPEYFQEEEGHQQVQN